MRITKLTAENFKRLKAVDITPDDHTVVIAGRNAQGKSSVLDAIMAALAGRNGAKELVRPIRDGESRARVVVELDELRVERKWTPSGSSVVVGPKEGNAKLNSPQAVLDKLIGSLSFDPLAFAQAEPKKQVETLIDLIGRDSFDTLARERKQAFDNRTDINREIRAAKARLDSLPEGLVATAKVDVAKLSLELEAAIEVEAARRQWQEIEDKIEQLRQQQARLQDAAADVIAKVKPRESEDIRQELQNASAHNEAAQAWADREALLKSLASLEGVSAKHTELIESVDSQKAALIAAAQLPVDGLSFDEEGVTLNGVPFVQASAAERLKVSVAMAMAMNPELRVICIRDASLLDDDSKRYLVELATTHDYQIWYEVVGDGGEIGVVIEDGQVQS